MEILREWKARLRKECMREIESPNRRETGRWKDKAKEYICEAATSKGGGLEQPRT